MNQSSLKKIANQDGAIPIQKGPLGNKPEPAPPAPDTTKKIINDNRYKVPVLKQAAWIYLAWLVLLAALFIGLWFWLIGAPQVEQEVNQRVSTRLIRTMNV